jgi:two-component system sensor histidine kinase UhpB
LNNISRVLAAGFACVIVLLVAAAFVGVRNIQSIQSNAARLVREQALANRLITQLQRQQSTLTEVFSVLARDPDSVDFDRIMTQLTEADSNIDRIAAEGARTPEHDLWARLVQSSKDFSAEARRLLNVEEPETFASVDLFRLHEGFVSVVAKLMERSYRQANEAQAQIDQRSARLVRESILFVGACVALALAFTVMTVRMATRLIRRIEWQAAELSRVSWHMLEDQETTARRFSHELHDELGQSLTAVKTNLSALDGDASVNYERVRDSIRLVDEAIGNVRQLSQLLRPTILDDFGLEAGLRWLCEGFATRTGIDVELESQYSGRLPDETETHLFRIAQEALTNVARHAGARHVAVRLEPRDGEIRLTISDDGRGLPPTVPAGARSLGMIGMRARARSAGGDATVYSRPGEGVVIEVRVPVKHETHPHPAG